MDYNILTDVINELSDVLADGRLERVFEGADRSIHLVFHVNRRMNRKGHILLLSADRSMPRIHLVSKKPNASESPCAFVQYLRGRLIGARLSRISLLNQDRIVELLFSKRGVDSSLIFELTGASANIIIAEGNGTVLTTYYPFQLSDNPKRHISSGSIYSLPEKHGEVRGAMKAASHPLPGAGFPANWGVESYYGKLVQDNLMRTQRSGLNSVIKKAASKTRRLIEALTSDLKSANKADEYRRAGDLILANIGLISNRTELQELVGHDGLAATVRLDPRLSPAGNAGAYFKKYKKARAGMKIISERLEQAHSEESYLDSVRSEIAGATAEEDLLRIRAGLEEKGYIKPVRGGVKTAKIKPSETRYRKIVYNGWEMVVGRSAAGNDYITTRLARPDDVWLHAEGIPGSHVILRNPGKIDVPHDVLMKAASLAAFHSKGRGAGKTPVAYTSVRFVKKPKGARPGSVVLSRRKTVMAAPEVP